MPRARRKGQFKLRFHHQALPQEYLDHYEASQNNLQTKKNEQIAATNSNNNNKNTKTMDANNDQMHQQQNVARSHDSVRNWLQKISEYQAENASTLSLKQEPDVELIATPVAGIIAAPAKKPSRVVSYSDLPYMGEMTLDNSKPRRGRKPKKADICHLIYKNYGTILPGTPKDIMETGTTTTTNVIIDPTVTFDIKKSDLQNKLISSLLEKRLTQDSIRLSPTTKVLETTGELLVPTNKNVGGECSKKPGEEPLNLCVRDISDTLTVSSGDTDTDSITESIRMSPLIPPSETDTLLAANLKMALPNFQSAMMDKSVVTSAKSIPSGPTSSDGTVPSNYVYWPSAGVFIHPMALYYQKMVDSGTPPALPHGCVVPATLSSATSSTSSTPGLSMTSPTEVSSVSSCKSPSIKRTDNCSPKILVPKNISQLIKQDKPTTSKHQHPVVAPMSSATTTTTSRTPSEASVSPKTLPPIIPQKRKRSAIFIPPMPPDTSSTNHATEVSICKFKFTGGAKPSLQEKKMLSVDSGGNFRYYSGTGDKSMRGYEFFPRESLQQSSLLTASSSGAFLNTPGEKISADLPPPSHGLSNELLHLPEIMPANCVVSGIPSVISRKTPSPTNLLAQHQHTTKRNSNSSSGNLSSDRRKRKSRRSLQREKLEKTFKEKGFLIQTQQLESAEGATYCKFRQLRKFTRYLFRSWKDYLPGDLQQGQVVLPPGSIPVDDAASAAALLASSKSNKLIVLPTTVDGSDNMDVSPVLEIIEH